MSVPVLRAAQSGDEQAFTRVFRALQPALLRYLRTLAGPAADDLAAETWVQVVRGLRAFRGDVDGFRAWVFTIAHHRYVDHVRRLGRQPACVDDAALAEQPAPRQVEDEVAELFSTERALALIGRLSPDQAEVVLLRVVAGLDVGRTAQVLGKRPGTVRVLAHRGLARLARILEQEPGFSATPAPASPVPVTSRRAVTQVTSTPRSSGVTPREGSSVTGES